MVIDIFRASTAICAALDYGVEAIIPVKTVQQALAYKAQGYLAAAERGGEIVKGFDLGNSPLMFRQAHLRNQTIVLTTSNCTRALLKATQAKERIMGSFINQEALIRHLEKGHQDTILLCAGWKNKFNLEDTLFAGSLVHRLKDEFYMEHCDSAIAAEQLYLHSKADLYGALLKSSHAYRLRHLDLEKDIRYCLTPDQTEVVPVFLDGKIVVA